MHPHTIQQIVNNGFKSDADVKHFFTEVRVLIERLNNHKKDYKVIKFYADWMLHIKKDNLDGMLEYFKKCDEILNESEILPVRNKLNNQIESFTSFDELRKQLREFSSSFRIDLNFLEVQSEWLNFSRHLRNLVLNKPILLGQLKNSGKRRKMVRFVLDTKAPYMIDIEGALYWMLFIDTSNIPLMGVVPESIGLAR